MQIASHSTPTEEIVSWQHKNVFSFRVRVLNVIYIIQNISQRATSVWIMCGAEKVH